MIKLNVSRVPVVLALLAILGVSDAPLTTAAEIMGNVNLLVGQKSLQKSDWEPLEDQTEVGVETTLGKQDWPIHFAADLLTSWADEKGGGIDFQGRTWEVALGGRKIWELGRARPFFGGGFTLILADVEASVPGTSISDDSNALGFWLGGGAFWRVGSHLNLGLSVRASRAEAKIFREDTELGGIHVGLLIGWGWPASK